MKNNVMKKTLLMAVLILTGSLTYGQTTSSTLSTDGMRIGFVDVERIKDGALFVQELRNTMQAELRVILEAHKARKEEYDKLQQEIRQQRSVLSQDGIDAKVKQAFQMKAKVEEEQYAIEKYLKEAELRSIAPAEQIIVKAIHEVARTRGFDIVLPRDVLIYGSPRADLSGHVVTYLNSVMKTPPASLLQKESPKADDSATTPQASASTAKEN